MSHLPSHLRYTKSHEWAEVQPDQIVRVGITDFAQQELGDLVYIELPKVGRTLSAGEQCAVVESVKTASDLFSPIAGEVVAVNEQLVDEPERVNNSPYQAWLFSIRTDDLSGLDRLMDADAYLLMIDQ
ncbi:MAG: glycine cleavage system protein GcvH [Methylococcaceae bacterium]|nr:glycine cleavage system protein GcvH [Methylococcaceae bacterium]